MSSITNVSDWPVASITVRFNRNAERGPLGMSARDIIEMVQAAIDADTEGSGLEFISKPYFYEQHAISFGQVSKYAEHHFIVVPKDEEEPFFLFDRKYEAVSIVSHTWRGSRLMREIDEEDIIVSAQDFANRFEAAYEEKIAQLTAA